jgi:hypothetical protein
VRVRLPTGIVTIRLTSDTNTSSWWQQREIFTCLHQTPKLIKRGSSPPRQQYEFMALQLGATVTILIKLSTSKFLDRMFVVVSV